MVVKPEMLVWAQRRASADPTELQKRFPKLARWQEGGTLPTLRQLEDFARAVHVPLGYLFLTEPVEEPLPIPDFRTLGSHGVERPSPHLLDTLYLCQQRQEWYREFARLQGQPQVAWIGSADQGSSPALAAESLRQLLGVSRSDLKALPNWTEALRFWMNRAEAAGVLVMASSIVGSNSHRKLRVEEFRGFALVDPWAPLVFLNAADTKAAQMFTLAHELAHLALGQSGVFNTEAGRIPDHRVEQWCNQAAAELLMPLKETQKAYQHGSVLADEIQRLAKMFKVSTLVALRRLADAGFLDAEALWSAYQQELDRLRAIDRSGTNGGDFYRTLGARTGKRFARAVLANTLEGHTLFQEAFRMLGIRQNETFYQAARELEVIP